MEEKAPSRFEECLNGFYFPRSNQRAFQNKVTLIVRLDGVMHPLTRLAPGPVVSHCRKYAVMLVCS
jgi:hypothetical protein